MSAQPERWTGLPEVNRRTVVRWLAVITVKAVMTPETPAQRADPGWGELPCPH